MASTYLSLNITAADGETPVTSNPDQTAIRMRNWFHARAGGNNHGTDTVVCRTAQEFATAEITCATVANSNTVTLNGTTLTAQQANARGTITPTLTGIDVDDTVTIQGVALTAKKHHSYGSVTITIANTDLGDTVTLNGVAFTAAAAEDTAAGEFDISGTATVAAASLAACINESVEEDIAGIFEAHNVSGVCNIRAVATGADTYTFESSDADGLAVTGSGTLTAGSVPDDDEFDFSGTTAEACTSIAEAIAANATLAALVTAWASATVVTVRAIDAGTGGNAITFVSSDAQLAVSGSGTLTGGAATANNKFDFGGTDTETAACLAAAINASTTALVNKHVTATSDGAVVTLTAVQGGHAGNAVTVATSGATLTITDSLARLAGGTETITTHSY